ncbi:YceI family protein [Ovoidimarina sediminis]|uniref:YceI family protein n=1 Tax=Ovoidimarina sediminis TaxID=3079856 RepID=UPI00290B5471|nr:YceI family protein [Rhodophyticola sp. MJ-SS7]MDU8946058.1 YceI family protein [Rhodophyticola sp. MJ-SS7]
MTAAIPLRAFLVLFLISAAPMGWAAPVLYVLDGDTSRVGFSVDFGPDEITGRFPVADAQLTLDFDKVSNTSVSVTLDAEGASASFPFAAQALKGPSILYTKKYPSIAFESTSVEGSTAGALVQGDLTIRGVTRPVALQAGLFRRAGTDPRDFSRLFIRLTGAVSRSAFGASGWPDAVSDEVRIDILAEVARVDAK